MLNRDLIPWDKSWAIRLGVLDLLHGCSDDILGFLDAQSCLGDDLASLRSAVACWDAGVPVDVGESGTLFRFLRYAAWKRGIDKEFVVRGTLRDRDICSDPDIINWPQTKLLTLDHGTSQWASAAVLCGDEERLPDAPFKLKLTYEAVAHWSRTSTIGWKPRKDETIERQAVAFVELLLTGKTSFVPQQAEDFCFAYTLCGMTAAEGWVNWPSLVGHESNRIDEMGQALLQAEKGEVVQSRDHRVVQAAAMWCKLNRKPLLFGCPGAVSKSWPQFWEFLKHCA